MADEAPSPSVNVAELPRIPEAEALSLVDETLGSPSSWPSGLLTYRLSADFQEDWKGEIGQWMGTARRFGFLDQMVGPLFGEQRRKGKPHTIDPNDKCHLKLHQYFAAGLFCHYLTGTGWNFGQWEPETGGSTDVDLTLTTPNGTLVEFQIKAPDQPGVLVGRRYQNGNLDGRVVVAVENAASQLRQPARAPAVIGLFVQRSISMSWDPGCLTHHLFGSAFGMGGGGIHLPHHAFGRFLYGWDHVAGVVTIDFLRGVDEAKYPCTVLLNPNATHPLDPDCFPRARVLVLEGDTFRWLRGPPGVPRFPSGTRVVERLPDFG